MAPSGALAPDEQVLFELRPHVGVLWRPVLLLLAGAPLIGYLVGAVPDTDGAWLARTVVVLIALALWGRWVVLPFVQWWSTLYLVTDQRLMLRRGLRPRVGRDFPLARVSDLRLSRGIVQQVLGSGTLEVDLIGEVGDSLQHLPRAEQVHSVLFRLVESARGEHHVDESVGVREGALREPFEDLLLPEGEEPLSDDWPDDAAMDDEWAQEWVDEVDEGDRGEGRGSGSGASLRTTRVLRRWNAR